MTFCSSVITKKLLSCFFIAWQPFQKFQIGRNILVRFWRNKKQGEKNFLRLSAHAWRKFEVYIKISYFFRARDKPTPNFLSTSFRLRQNTSKKNFLLFSFFFFFLLFLNFFYDVWCTLYSFDVYDELYIRYILWRQKHHKLYYYERPTFEKRLMLRKI